MFNTHLSWKFKLKFLLHITLFIYCVLKVEVVRRGYDPLQRVKPELSDEVQVIIA